MLSKNDLVQLCFIQLARLLEEQWRSARENSQDEVYVTGRREDCRALILYSWKTGLSWMCLSDIGGIGDTCSESVLVILLQVASFLRETEYYKYYKHIVRTIYIIREA